MEARQSLLMLFKDGIQAVSPDTALLSHITVDGDIIKAAGKIFKIPASGLKVIGAGKGAAPMARALENLLGIRIKEGYIVVKYGHVLPLEHFKIAEASHPVPDAAGEKAAQKCLEIAASCGRGDLLVCLFTGGASALLPSPVRGVSLDDLQKTTSALLACGADIQEINTIRRHISNIGGGGIVKAANGATILSLIVSDVIGDNLIDIASGPTSRDNSSFNDCLKILAKYDIAKKIPKVVLEYLENGSKTEDREKLDVDFGNVTNLIIASNRQALEAMAQKAQTLGFSPEVLKEPVSGEARDVARELIGKARDIQKNLSDKPVCLLAGGESTVTIRGNGKGGRNQEMALTAALELSGTTGISALFGGTDGTDGPTDAAGGFAFSSSIAQMGGREKAELYLRNNDSYTALEKAGDLLQTGPTLTNVMDVAIILINPSH